MGRGICGSASCQARDIREWTWGGRSAEETGGRALNSFLKESAHEGGYKAHANPRHNGAWLACESRIKFFS